MSHDHGVRIKRRVVRPLRRDLLLGAAAACSASAIAVGHWADVDGTVVLVGSQCSDQVRIALWSAAILLTGAWVIARCWVHGGPTRPLGRAVSTVLTGVTLAGVTAAEVLALYVHAFSSVNVYEKFDVPSTGDTYVLATQRGVGGSWVGLYRGGPLRFHHVPIDLPGTDQGQLIAEGRFHVERADDGSPVLVYPTSTGDARVSLP